MKKDSSCHMQQNRIREKATSRLMLYEFLTAHSTLSQSQRVATVPPPPPESAEDSGKQLNLKSGSKSLREMDESKIRKYREEERLKQLKSGSKSVHDMDESEIRKKYDESEEPFCYICDRFKYRNKAQIRLDEEIKKAMDEYTRQTALLPPGPYDAIDPPAIARLCGSLRPLTITAENRDRLTRFCNLALDKYNTETENQGEVFVFHDLVKSTRRLVSGDMYYITFQAKAGRDAAAIQTFQAQVWHRMPGQGPPVVKSCSIKPSS